MLVSVTAHSRGRALVTRARRLEARCQVARLQWLAGQQTIKALQGGLLCQVPDFPGWPGNKTGR
eukprot:567139-Karenia_brevis.AAC.1